MIFKLSKEHIREVANIDVIARKGEFLPSLGSNFLFVLYSTLIELDSVFGYVYKENSKVIGFVIGVTDTTGLFTKALLKNGLNIFIALLPRILTNPLFLLNIIDTFLYPLRENKIAIKPELLVIGIDETHRKKGLGHVLVNALNTHFSNTNIDIYKVTVTQDNIFANNFYKKMGFVFKYSFLQYRKYWNLYSYNIKRENK